MEDTVDRIAIDYMMLADGAQAVGGKLYILGGAWERLFLPEVPGAPVAPFALAVAVTVPWHLTNRRFAFSVELTDADNNQVGDVLKADLEAGRPPGLRPGTPQRLVFAVNSQPDFPAEGRYVFHGSIDGERVASAKFEVTRLSLQPAQAD